MRKVWRREGIKGRVRKRDRKTEGREINVQTLVLARMCTQTYAGAYTHARTNANAHTHTHAHAHAHTHTRAHACGRKTDGTKIKSNGEKCASGHICRKNKECWHWEEAFRRGNFPEQKRNWMNKKKKHITDGERKQNISYSFDRYERWQKFIQFDKHGYDLSFFCMRSTETKHEKRN